MTDDELEGAELAPRPRPEELTQLLNRWSTGSEDAERQLFDVIYPQLRKIASRSLRGERPSATLQTTDLVHEAYELLVEQRTSWHNRMHFFAISAQFIRRILIDRARRRGRIKHGADRVHLSIDATHLIADDRGLLAIDDALRTLAAIDPTAARLVELRYFGGLSIEEVAAVLGCGRSTAVRTWRFARAWLKSQLNPDDPQGSGGSL